ncbi:MAG: cobyrinate a,c-diamide synthase [Deltaproteobacteria bacterium]|nr:MAG: cobyrinate a,c-diamide synthase [Deltaproteobacteria bacterium]
MTKGFVIAGTHSGAGKTTITLGMMLALSRRGLKVAPFKVGPDFIDPGHHRVAVGVDSRNLDGWMLEEAWNRACFGTHAADADIAVVEGVMGVYDGFSGTSEAGSTAQMAKWLDLPVVLVVNAASMARSVAALVQGFERFDPAVTFAGAIFNNLGSSGHLDYLTQAMDAYVDMPVLGGFLRDETLKMPERHLGLVTAEDRPLSGEWMETLADRIEAQLDLDRLLEALPKIDLPRLTDEKRSVRPPAGIRIGVARDRAFCFYYPDNLDLLREAGAELIAFSPLNDTALPDGLDGIYFGGGYPELHAAALAANKSMREAVQRYSRRGLPIYGECGGFMYLCRELTDVEGGIHAMCGCFPFATQMHAKLRVLGYRQVVLAADTPLGPAGSVLRGHEFHYSNLTAPVVDPSVQAVYTVSARKGGKPGSEGYRVNRTLGSYIHLHFGSRPESATAFVDLCKTVQHQRRSTHETRAD